MSEHYILDGHKPATCDFMTWALWFEKADRHVAKTEKDGVLVSTVFIGLDHQRNPDGAPLLFETKIFGGPEDGYCERRSTWEGAELMHKHACELAFPVTPLETTGDPK